MLGELILGLILAVPAWGVGELGGRGILAYRNRERRPNNPKALQNLFLFTCHGRGRKRAVGSGADARRMYCLDCNDKAGHTIEFRRGDYANSIEWGLASGRTGWT